MAAGMDRSAPGGQTATQPHGRARDPSVWLQPGRTARLQQHHLTSQPPRESRAASTHPAAPAPTTNDVDLVWKLTRTRSGGSQWACDGSLSARPAAVGPRSAPDQAPRPERGLHTGPIGRRTHPTARCQPSHTGLQVRERAADRVAQMAADTYRERPCSPSSHCGLLRLMSVSLADNSVSGLIQLG